MFDHVHATYQPPRPDGRYRDDVGKRGLFQALRVITVEERIGTPGEWAMMPRLQRRGHRFGFHVCPLSHLVDLVPATADEARWRSDPAA